MLAPVKKMRGRRRSTLDCSSLLLYSTPLFSTSLFSTLLYSACLYQTILYLGCSTLQDSTLTFFFFHLLYSAPLCFGLPCSTLSTRILDLTLLVRMVLARQFGFQPHRTCRLIYQPRGLYHECLASVKMKASVTVSPAAVFNAPPSTARTNSTNIVRPTRRQPPPPPNLISPSAPLPGTRKHDQRREKKTILDSKYSSCHASYLVGGRVGESVAPLNTVKYDGHMWGVRVRHARGR